MWQVCTDEPVLFRVVRLVVSCVVLGIGVAMLLIAALGSDGYSTMINGLAIALDVGFFWVNLVVGIALVAMAWARGLQPGTFLVIFLLGPCVEWLSARFKVLAIEKTGV